MNTTDVIQLIYKELEVLYIKVQSCNVRKYYNQIQILENLRDKIILRVEEEIEIQKEKI